MKRFISQVLLLCSVLYCAPARAHHGSGGGTGSFGQMIADRLNPPRTSVYFTTGVDILDEDLGEVWLYQLQGEYAIHRKFSLGARIPFWSTREEYLPSSNQIGDVSLLLKGEAWRHNKEKAQLLYGLETSFPTGDSNITRSAGVVVFSPYLSFSRDFGLVQLLASTGMALEASSTWNPTLAYELGLAFPIIDGRVPLNFLLDFQGNTFFDSDTFENGSSKAFIVFGPMVTISKNWELDLFGKVSVLDTLDFVPNVSQKNFTTGLLNDVKTGFILSLSYQF